MICISRRARAAVSIAITAFMIVLLGVLDVYVPTSQRVPGALREFADFGLPVILIASIVLIWVPRRTAIRVLLVAGILWIALRLLCEIIMPGFGELEYLISLPLGLLVGSLVAWAGPKWSWLQFRLRTMLLLVLACAGLLAAFDHYLGKPGREQAAAIATIEKLGGEVKTEPAVPEWLARYMSSPRRYELAQLIAGRHYREITSITVRGTNADEILNVLPQLRGVQGAGAIRSISLNESSVTDEGLSHIAACKHLIYLQLANTAISDSGLVHLRECSELEQLDVSFCHNVTDRSVAVFKRLQNLRSLVVYKTRFTSVGARETRDALPRCELPPDFTLFQEHHKRKQATGTF